MDESDDSKETTSPTPDTEQVDDDPEAQEKKEEKKEGDNVSEPSSPDVNLNASVSSTTTEPPATETPTERQSDVELDTSSTPTQESDQPESKDTSTSIGDDGFLELDPETERRMRELEEAEAQKAAEVEEEEEPQEVGIFAVKTSIGHEKMVANWLAMRVRKRKLEVYAILSPPKLRGYLLLEGIKNKEALQDMIKGVQHARSVVDGASSLEEIEHFLTPKPLVSGIEEGDVVEIIAGPFKGEKAKVTQIDESKEEITVELFEAMVSIPVTIRGDHVRILEKENK